MSSTRYDIPQASPQVQTRRVLLLARMMTVMTMSFAGLLYLVVEAAEHAWHCDIALDQALLDWRPYALIFVFWTSVMAGMRRPLHLHE